jgi:hypothetical protein
MMSIKTKLKTRFSLLVKISRPIRSFSRALFRYDDRIYNQNLVRFKDDLERYKKQAIVVDDCRFEINERSFLPILDENTKQSSFDAHYVYHTSWAARLLARNSPRMHHDFGSDLRFSTLVSAFIPMVFYDYRPLKANMTGLSCKRADLMKLDLESGSIHSLSCMHVIEHVGLGRYGEPINPKGDIIAITELKRILAKDGDIYFVVPVGRGQLRFNAHRIYSFEMIKTYFSDFDLKEFALVNDAGEFIEDASEELVNQQAYGCGCFWFRKSSQIR